MRGLLVWSAILLLILPATALYLNKALGPSAQQAGAEAAHPPSAAAAPAAPVGSGSGAPASRSATWAKAPLLERVVQEAMADFPGVYSVVVQDLHSGERFALNPDRPYHPASTIKLPVTLYALEQYRAGKARWTDLIEYTPADFESPGGGLFETSPFGGLYAMENLVNRALTYSNNVAVNMLGRHFGWGNIEAWTKSIGADLTWVDGSPQVTAMSELGWWLHLYKLSQEDPASAELLLDPLRKVEYNGRITAGLPQGTPHLHKFGSYNGNFHDGGIIFTERPYILIALTYGAEIDQADTAIARLSADVYAVMTAGDA